MPRPRGGLSVCFVVCLLLVAPSCLAAVPGPSSTGRVTDGASNGAAVNGEGPYSLYGFEVVDERPIEEYKANGTLYRHLKTGAELLSVHSDDDNKVFGASFRTPATSFHGTTHVLEHSVLSGSQRFPIKELFAELQKGSLATYLNALTYPDKTVYPTASTNLQDLRNLVDVYMDVVLHPLLPGDHRIFEKEGWHYEVDDKGNLSYSGVVLAEMKGVYSSPDSLNGIIIQRELFRNNSYRFDSGGRPQDIPDLTFEELVGYYRAYYHPSNARFWLWGDGPSEEERLRLVDGYLAGFGDLPVESEIAVQPLYQEPVSVVEFYPAGGGTSKAVASDQQPVVPAAAAAVAASTPSAGPPKAFCTLSWVLAEDHWGMEMELAGSFLDYLLLGTRAAPLHKALVDSGLGEEVIGSGGGLSLDLRQPTYTVGLKGVDPHHCEDVFDLIMHTMARLEAEGFNASAIEAAVNTIEFQLRENNTGGFPRGLNQMLRALRYWLYGKDPFEPMLWNDPLEHLKAQLAEGEDIFGPLITQLFLANNHRVDLSLLPDSELGAEMEAAEQERLQAAAEELGPAGLGRLKTENEELKRWQEEPNSPEELLRIPTLQVHDIDPHTVIIPTELSSIARGEALQLAHPLSTNGILYLDLAMDMQGLPPNLLPLVPLFCSGLTEMGTHNRSFVELTELIGRKTGGISASAFVSSVKGRLEDPAAYIMVSGKAVVSKVPDMLAIVREILQEVKLDNQDRFHQLTLEEKSSLERAVVEGGNRFANLRLQAQRSVAGWANEQMAGISYIDFIRGLVGRVEKSWPEVLRGLESIRSYVLQREGALINLTVDEDLLADVEPGVHRFLDTLPSSPQCQPAAWTSVLEPANEVFLVPTQVSHVCKSGNLYQDAAFNWTEAGSIYVATHYLDTTWLWDRVRVLGGAYGAGSSFDLSSGMFTFCSFRDPHLLDTVEVFDGSVGYLADGNPSNNTITKSIVGAIGTIVDPYMLPDAKGYTALTRHILEITDQERQARRDLILATTADDFRALAPILEAVAELGKVAAVTSAAQAADANKARPGFFQKTQQVL